MIADKGGGLITFIARAKTEHDFCVLARTTSEAQLAALGSEASLRLSLP